MVAALARHETVFTVLAEAARKRTARGLAIQLMVSGAVAAIILLVARHWWSLAFLAGWSAAYSAWGLIVRVAESREHARPLRLALATIAAVGTALAIMGIIGVGLAIYSGNAGGAKTTCSEHSTNKYCQAWRHPAPLTKLP